MYIKKITTVPDGYKNKMYLDQSLPCFGTLRSQIKKKTFLQLDSPNLINYPNHEQ